MKDKEQHRRQKKFCRKISNRDKSIDEICGLIKEYEAQRFSELTETAVREIAGMMGVGSTRKHDTHLDGAHTEKYDGRYNTLVYLAQSEKYPDVIVNFDLPVSNTTRRGFYNNLEIRSMPLIRETSEIERDSFWNISLLKLLTPRMEMVSSRFVSAGTARGWSTPASIMEDDYELFRRIRDEFGLKEEGSTYRMKEDNRTDMVSETRFIYQISSLIVERDRDSVKQNSPEEALASNIELAKKKIKDVQGAYSAFMREKAMQY
ncbi:MAG: hypothetical protein R6U32_01060 [Candidatus Woesearchaeota archaeon]